MLPSIVGTITGAEPILEMQQREREGRERQYREEEASRYEARRFKEIDDERWNRFREFAGNWEERQRLLVFIAGGRRWGRRRLHCRRYVEGARHDLLIIGPLPDR